MMIQMGRSRLAAAFALAAAVVFGLAEHLNWMPKILPLDMGPVWGV